MGLMERLGFVPATRYERAVADLREEVAGLNRRLAFRSNDGKKEQEIASGVETSYGKFRYESNQKLLPPAVWDTLEQMEADPHIKGSLRTNSLPLLGAQWEIEAASDKPEDQKVAQFVAANLLCDENDEFGREYWVRSSWFQRLFEILQMLRDGYAVFGTSKRRVGMYRVFDTIRWIEPQTIDGTRPWDLDAQENIRGVNRTFTDAVDDYHYDDYLPASRIKLYPWEFKGARYEGRELIRSMYGAYFRKEYFQRLSAIWAQKKGAPPPEGFYPPDWDQNQIADFIDHVKSLRGTAPAESFGVFPTMDDGTPPTTRYAGDHSEASRVDQMVPLIDSENREISHAGSTKSDQLGETQTGSRALGGSMQRREMLLVETIAAWVCTVENVGVGNIKGTIPELVDDNFPGLKKYPKLKVSKIDPTQGREDAPHIIAAAKVGIIPKKDPDFRRQFTERYGFNLEDDVYEEWDEPEAFGLPGIGGPNDPDQKAQPGGGKPDAKPPEGGTNDKDRAEAEARLAAKDAFKKALKPFLERGTPPVKGGNFRT